MVDSNFLINRPNHFPGSKINLEGHASQAYHSEAYAPEIHFSGIQAAEAYTSEEMNQRLGLYRVFLKLYEHHRTLLDEILDLENTEAHESVRQTWHYIQAGVQASQAYLTTNLIQDQTHTIRQSQGIWVMGRDRKAGISIQDKRLSRRHAMIEYVPNQGFFLSDLRSTNGTFVNGEPIHRPRLLQDGDRVRLSSLSFMFFICHCDRTLEEIPPEILAHLRNSQSNVSSFARKSNYKPPVVSQRNPSAGLDLANTPLPESCKETYGFFQEETI